MTDAIKAIGTTGILLLLLVSPALGLVSAKSDSTQGYSVSALANSQSIQGLISSINKTAALNHEGNLPTGLFAAVSSAISNANEESGVDSAIADHGSESFSWGLGYSFIGGVSASTVGLGVSWVQGYVARGLEWTVYLGNQTIRGPASTSWPLETNTATYAWAGYEYHESPTAPLNYAISDVNVPTISAPSSPVTTDGVEASASIWLGYSNSAGGSGGLIQTGVTRDTTSSSTYQLWYELYGCSGCGSLYYQTQYPSADCTSGVNTASASDSLQLDVSQTGGNSNSFQVYDVTSNIICTLSYLYSETPYYAQTIVEATQNCTSAGGGRYYHLIDQIPNLGSGYTTSFSSGEYQFVSGGQDYLQTFNNVVSAAHYNSYSLTQSSGVTNIQPTYSSTNGGVSLDYSSSSYNLNYVNGSPQGGNYQVPTYSSC